MSSSFLHSFAKPSSDAFINIVRGDMALLWDDKGNEYIDGIGSLWYCQIGHGRTEMADAVAAQISTLETYSTFDPFTNPLAEEVAEVIASLSPIANSRVFLCGSGSESIDSAMKIARTSQIQSGHSERSVIISRNRGYHGTNYGGTSAQGLPLNKVGYGTLLEGVLQVEADDIEAMSVAFQQNKGNVAAVIAEPVQGAGGVWPATREYLEALRRLCDDNGAYLIFDEVITGFGRLGEWFGATYYGVTPDMITFAKGVTSGYQPLGGVITGPAINAALTADPTFFLRHGYTYSGHATVCAAALKNIEIMKREQLVQRAQHVGQRIEAGLAALSLDGTLTGYRGAGAIWAGKLPDTLDATVVRDAMITKGVIARSIPGVIAFCPPLVITDAQVDTMLDVFASVVQSH
ncbi:MAG: aminotransferase class III-fold pyridoxal phosphate-dependent enzyme [Actinobacteria bacterium]|nr:aminotransferase class III-fold pyridoxal phosphate-dependent enzyme [Actinomycetota bacterium]